LEFRWNDESGELVDSIVMNGPADTSFGYSMEKLHAGKSPFLYIPSCPQQVFDTRTRVFYELPEFRVALDETSGYICRCNFLKFTRIAFTNECIVSLNYYNKDCLLPDRPTVIQVFTLPPDSSSAKNGNRVLCLTHEGLVPVGGFHPMNVELLKPVVDPVTGATHLRLLDYTNRNRNFGVTRIDLTLPEPCADKVSPMTVEMRQYKLLNYESQPAYGYEACLQYVDISEEGVVRGFYKGMPRHPTPFDDVVKFTIDTRQDEWVIDCGKLSCAEWSGLAGDTWLPEDIMFDGMRGKICFRNKNFVVVASIE